MSDELINDYGYLYGVSKKLQGPIVNSITGVMNGLKHYRVVSSGGDHGSITVWEMDCGHFRCGFYRFGSAIDEQNFDFKYQVKDWLIEWFPKQRNFT